jgi:rare lipoprotein A
VRPSVVGIFAAAMTLLLGLAGCASSRPQHGSSGTGTEGVASYYAQKFQGRPTASGEKFDNGKLTAAHRTLPFGTKVRVTNLGNGRSVTVRVNDRGPFVRGRVIDLSYAAARRIDMVRTGIARVRVEPVSARAGRALSRAD